MATFSTGVFATEHELEELDWMKRHSSLPNDFDFFAEHTTKLAKRHGLPEIVGYYFINDHGEFYREI